MLKTHLFLLYFDLWTPGAELNQSLSFQVIENEDRCQQKLAHCEQK